MGDAEVNGSNGSGPQAYVEVDGAGIYIEADLDVLEAFDFVSGNHEEFVALSQLIPLLEALERELEEAREVVGSADVVGALVAGLEALRRTRR